VNAREQAPFNAGVKAVRTMALIAAVAIKAPRDALISYVDGRR
jgi:hypothetical protein